MRRDTLVFALAGVVFGFVVGYMTSSWGQPARAARPMGAASAAAVPAASASALDPNEERALVALAERDPGNVAVRVELGTLYMESERWDDSIRWSRQALALNPGLTDVLIDVGACLIHSGRPAEGLAEFDTVLARDKGHRTALYNKGIALVQLGRTDEAVAVWEEALRRHADDPQLQGLRAQVESIRAASGGGRS